MCDRKTGLGPDPDHVHTGSDRDLIGDPTRDDLGGRLTGMFWRRLRRFSASALASTLVLVLVLVVARSYIPRASHAEGRFQTRTSLLGATVTWKTTTEAT